LRKSIIQFEEFGSIHELILKQIQQKSKCKIA